MVTVEVSAVPGFVGIAFTTDDDRVELVLTTDQARDLANQIGAGILTAARTGVMTS